MKAVFLYDRTIYPAIFRLLLGITILVDLIMLFPYINDIYNKKDYVYFIDSHIPFLQLIRDNIYIYYTLFILIILFFINGIGKRYISFLVFVFFLIKFLLLAPNLSYGTYILRISLLFFIFINSYQYLAFQKSYENSILSRLGILSIMFHVCLIYFSNAVLKVINPSWQQGDALGYFFLSAQTSDIFGIGDIALGYPYLLTLASYFVVAFQLLFPIFIWFKKTKYLFIIIGIIMHVSMALVLQLYFFEIVVILHYGFFIKDEEWRKLLRVFKLKNIHGER